MWLMGGRLNPGFLRGAVNLGYAWFGCHRHEQNEGLKRTRLINDIEVVLHGGSRDGPEILL